MKILVIDGQGGKMGGLIVKKIKEERPSAEVYAVGTNSTATAVMMRAGADFGATGRTPWSGIQETRTSSSVLSE